MPNAGIARGDYVSAQSLVPEDSSDLTVCPDTSCVADDRLSLSTLPGSRRHVELNTHLCPIIGVDRRRTID